MEGADPDAVGSLLDKAVDPFPHLLRRFICKCNRQNIPRPHPRLLDQIGNPIGQRPGFAGSCPRKDQKRAFRVKNGLPLHRIQRVIFVHFRPLSIYRLSMDIYSLLFFRYIDHHFRTRQTVVWVFHSHWPLAPIR